MATEKQLIANRKNAQKSTGPRTQQGKALASQNSLKHGLLSRQTVITTESRADFDLHRDQMLTELAPHGPTESMLVQRIVTLSWRLRRADRVRTATINTMHSQAQAPPSPLIKLTQSLLTKANDQSHPGPAVSKPDLNLGRMIIKDFSHPRVLDRLLMYERRIEHSLYKTILELQRLRLIRQMDLSDPSDNLSRRSHHSEAGTPSGPEHLLCKTNPISEKVK